MVYYLTSGVFFYAKGSTETNDIRQNSKSRIETMQEEELSYSETLPTI